MRRSDKRNNTMLWQRILDATLSVVVGGFVLSVLSVATGVAPVLFSAASEQLANVPVPELLANDPETNRWYQPVLREISETWQLTTQTVSRIFSNELLQFAQVGTDPPELPDPSADPTATAQQFGGALRPATDPAAGTLRINTPLLLDAGLQVTGASQLATTTVVGQLQAGTALLDVATIAGELTAETAVLDSVTVAGALGAGSVTADTITSDSVTTDSITSGLAAADSLSVSGASELGTLDATAATFGTLSVSGTTELSELLVQNAFTLEGLFTARGGIVTGGANIDVGDGEIFASNIVNQIIAGDNVIISGTQNEPIIGVDTDDLVGVLSLNNETGDVDLRGGVDIIVSGTQIRNTSNLASVRSRGGCADCITDGDVRSDLTISAGRIDATPIGSTTPSTGRFTQLTAGTSTATTALAVGGDATIDNVLNVSGNATSTFQGSVNIADGCFAIGGVCIEGVEPSSYVGLNDTPNNLIAGALQFVNADADALIQSLDFVFVDGKLGIGTSTPEATLSVVGDAAVSEGLQVGDGLDVGAGLSVAGAASVGDTLGVGSDTTIGGLLQVTGGATSTIAGGLNVTGGCVAVDGTCLISGVNELVGLNDVSFSGLASGDLLIYSGTEWQNATTSALGLGDGTYVGLFDTPESYVPGALQFANASGTALTQVGNLVFTDTGRLGIGTSTPEATLSVVGDAAVSEGLQVGDGLDVGAGLSVAGAASVGDTLGVGSDTTIGGLLQVTGGATSTFANGIDISSGCFAINGECLIEGVDRLVDLSDVVTSGLQADDLLVYNGSQWENVTAASLGIGDIAYLDLVDTPGSYTAAAIPFATAAADGLTQSSSFIYDGSRLGVATDDLRSTLTVGGGLSLLDNGALRFYDTSNTEYVGFRAPGTVASTTVWTLPEEDGSADHLLVTDGDGTLRFADVSTIGGGATTYLDLLDTPSLFATSSLVFVNEDGDALTQSENLTFAAGELVLDGEAQFLNSGGTVGFNYVRGSGGRVGIGTAATGDRLTVRGPVTQFGGTAADMYTPSQVAALNLPTGFSSDANDVDVVGNFAYIVTGFQGDDFHVVDITDPSNPFEISSIELPTTGQVVTVQGQYAYVGTTAQGDDFHVIDISNPLDPIEVASLNLPASVNDIFIQGRFAYVATDSVEGGDEFHVLDISNPINPDVVGSEALADSARSVALAGSFAYVVSATQGDDFQVIDISDPFAPVEVSGLNFPTGATDVAVRGSYAFITLNDTAEAFKVVDVTNPLTPTEVGSVGLDSLANAVDLAGRYAYVVTNSAGDDIHVIDIQDPAAPVEVGDRSLAAGNALGVRVSGRYVYITSASSGDTFHVLDITGAEMQSAVVHSLQGGALSVSGDGVVAGRVQAGLGLRAGAEGVQTDGSISALGDGASYIAGRLGVGTSTPSSQLTVAGTIRSTSLAGTTTEMLATDALGNIIRNPSDERLKRNITDIDGALDMVLQLRGVRYEWKEPERYGSAPAIGFIAQEVDGVVPEAVQRGEDYWSLNPARLVAVVVEAIKELWSELHGTQSDVETLEQRVRELERRVDSTEEGVRTSSSDNTSSTNATTSTNEPAGSTDSATTTPNAATTTDASVDTPVSTTTEDSVSTTTSDAYDTVEPANEEDTVQTNPTTGSSTVTERTDTATVTDTASALDEAGEPEIDEVEPGDTDLQATTSNATGTDSM